MSESLEKIDESLRKSSYKNSNLNNRETNKTSTSFQLKGRLFTLSVLQIQNFDIKKIDKELEDKIKLAPKFFLHAPVVIDLSDAKTKEQIQFDFNELKKTIKKHGLIPVGVKGTNLQNNKNAQDAGFAIMTDNDNYKQTSYKKQNSNTNQTPTTNSEEENKHYSKLITQPIRSGQQVYSPGDLVIVSSVSPGAELLAEGSIHVYGTLRGRALAGINGLKSARIFCNNLEAELVSIAGQYKIFEDIQEHNDQTSKQLYLDDTQLIIKTL